MIGGVVRSVLVEAFIEAGNLIKLNARELRFVGKKTTAVDTTPWWKFWALSEIEYVTEQVIVAATKDFSVSVEERDDGSAVSVTVEDVDVTAEADVITDLVLVDENGDELVSFSLCESYVPPAPGNSFGMGEPLTCSFLV